MLRSCQLGKKLRTQTPSPQIEKRCLLHSWNRGRDNTKQGSNGVGEKEHYRCSFSLDTGKFQGTSSHSLVLCTGRPLPSCDSKMPHQRGELKCWAQHHLSRALPCSIHAAQTSFNISPRISFLIESWPSVIIVTHTKLTKFPNAKRSRPFT